MDITILYVHTDGEHRTHMPQYLVNGGKNATNDKHIPNFMLENQFTATFHYEHISVHYLTFIASLHHMQLF